ncbi:hypothetical protein GQ607_009530 [Colletotrichum asianum]|uniref:Uncharacterized protein n=1 Tax=Colletotrichum asianum TaxID=702518 RepID=A0A8H3W689_9PEZI|nr:hypothetical protein GQ607_009530 [Colletotrichum asianum]
MRSGRQPGGFGFPMGYSCECHTAVKDLDGRRRSARWAGVVSVAGSTKSQSGQRSRNDSSGFREDGFGRAGTAATTTTWRGPSTTVYACWPNHGLPEYFPIDGASFSSCTPDTGTAPART